MELFVFLVIISFSCSIARCGYSSVTQSESMSIHDITTQEECTHKTKTSCIYLFLSKMDIFTHENIQQ